MKPSRELAQSLTVIPAQRDAEPDLQSLPDTLVIPPAEELNTEQKESRVRTAFRRARIALEMAVVAAEVTPVNEAMRYGAYGSAVAAGVSSPVAGAILGGATFAIEGVAAWSTADLLDTPAGASTVERINDRIKKSRTLSRVLSPKHQMSPLVESGVAFGGGSAVVLFQKQREDQTRTKDENRRRGLLTATYLGGALGVSGVFTAEGIDVVPPTTIGAGLVIAGGISAGIKSVKNRRAERSRQLDERADWHKGLTYKIATDAETLESAAVLEQDVWTEKDYGDLYKEGYVAHNANSRTIVSYDDDKCVGMTRLFRGNEDMVPPFLELPFDDDDEKLAMVQGSMDGTLEELGTTAVTKELRGKDVNTRMWRLAWRDAEARGVKQWGIIMEPERVAKMNKYHGFGFRQLGEPVPYQNGDCAAFVMDFDNLESGMKQTHPLSYYWFVKKSLKPLF